MAKDCDFYDEKYSKRYCMLKHCQEISYEHYKEYCKGDYSKNCPIRQAYNKNRKDW